MYSYHSMIRILVVLEVNSLIIEAKQSTYQVMSWEVGSQKLTEVYKKSFGFLETHTRGENNKFKKTSGVSSIILDRSRAVYGL
jgi:hypothetical protein